MWVPLIILAAIVTIVVATLRRKSRRPNPLSDISGAEVKPTVVIDLDVPFTSLVIFMIKVVLAAIPAAILAASIIAMASAFMVGLSLETAILH